VINQEVSSFLFGIFQTDFFHIIYHSHVSIS